MTPPANKQTNKQASCTMHYKPQSLIGVAFLKSENEVWVSSFCLENACQKHKDVKLKRLYRPFHQWKMEYIFLLYYTCQPG